MIDLTEDEVNFDLIWKYNQIGINNSSKSDHENIVIKYEIMSLNSRD